MAVELTSIAHTKKQQSHAATKPFACNRALTTLTQQFSLIITETFRLSSSSCHAESTLYTLYPDTLQNNSRTLAENRAGRMVTIAGAGQHISNDATRGRHAHTCWCGKRTTSVLCARVSRSVSYITLECMRARLARRVYHQSVDALRKRNFNERHIDAAKIEKKKN